MSDTKEIHEARINYFNFTSKKVNEHITYSISLFLILFTTIESKIFPIDYNIVIFISFIPLIIYNVLRTLFWSGYADISIWVNPYEYNTVEEITSKSYLHIIQDSIVRYIKASQKTKWRILKEINFINFIKYYIPFMVGMVLIYIFKSTIILILSN